jgi:transposase
MDTYASQVTTDSLGRRGGPRRRRPLEEKRKIVEETLEPGASVAIVARRYELNANVIFGWRRLYRAGRLGGSPEASLIPVKVIAPDPAPGATKTHPRGLTSGNSIEVLLADGTQVRVSGELADEALRQIIATVRAR